MKVLFIIQDVEAGGAANIVIDNIIELRNNGVDIEVAISKKGRFSIFCEKMGIRYFALGHTQYYIGGGSTIIRKLIRRLLYPYYMFRYRIRNKRAIKTAIEQIDFKDIDLIYSNYNGNDIGAELSKIFDKPHIWHIREFGELDFGCMSLKKNYIQYMNRSHSQFIAISHSVKEYWGKKGLCENSINTIYDSIETFETDNCIRESSGSKEPLRCIISGTIHPNKGQIQLIRAVRKLGEKAYSIRVDIYGGGAIEYILYLKFLVYCYGLQNVFTFKGYDNDLKKKLGNYDIGFMCSKSEGFGLVTIEYMMAGLTVIGANSGGTAEIIHENYNGLLYHYGDLDNMAEIIKVAISNKDLRDRIGRNARRTSREMFNIDNNALYEYMKAGVG